MLRVCARIHGTYGVHTVHTIELNWKHRPRFLLLCDANYIVQGENKRHVHFSLSSLLAAAVVAVAPVASITAIATTAAAATTALAAQSAVAIQLTTRLCLLPDLHYTKLIPSLFFSVCVFVGSLVSVSVVISFHCLLYPWSVWKNSFIVWSKLQQCSHSFTKFFRIPVYTTINSEINNITSDLDGHFWTLFMHWNDSFARSIKSSVESFRGKTAFCFILTWKKILRQTTRKNYPSWLTA